MSTLNEHALVYRASDGGLVGTAPVEAASPVVPGGESVVASGDR